MRGKPTEAIQKNSQAALDAQQEAFITGNATAQAEQISSPKAPTVPAAPPAVPIFSPANDRVNKTIRISKSLETKLKREALKRSEKTGARVTESDLIEIALQGLLLK